MQKCLTGLFKVATLRRWMYTATHRGLLYITGWYFEREGCNTALRSVSMSQENKKLSHNSWDFSCNAPLSGGHHYPPHAGSIASPSRFMGNTGSSGDSQIHTDGLSWSPSDARPIPVPGINYIHEGTYSSSPPELISGIPGGKIELSSIGDTRERLPSHNFEEMENFLKNMGSSNTGPPMNPGQNNPFPNTRHQQASSSSMCPLGYIQPFKAYERLLQKPPLPTDEFDGFFPADQKAEPTGGDGYICKVKAYIPRNGPAEWIFLDGHAHCDQHFKSKDSYRRHIILCHFGCRRQDGATQYEWIEKRYNEAKTYQI